MLENNISYMLIDIVSRWSEDAALLIQYSLAKEDLTACAKPKSGLTVGFFFFFFFSGGGGGRARLRPFQEYFTYIEPIFHLVGENRRTRGKTIWPSVSRTWLSHMWPERGANHSGEKPNALRVHSPIHSSQSDH